MPVELPCRVPRRDHRALRRGERGHADPRRHRLVQVDDVEALASSARRSRRPTLGVRTMFGSEPLAGTITERPTGITSSGGSPCRPWRGCRARVNVPGGSLPMIVRVSIPACRGPPPGAPRARSRRPRTTTRRGRRCRPSRGNPMGGAAVHSADGLPGRPGRAAHAPGRLGRLRDHVEPRARAGHRAAGEGLLGVRPPRHGLRPARRAEPRRAERHLSLDGAHPVEPARGRALRARGDRRRVPLAGHHDARDPLQPDEAEPRRRARPRPHHPRRDPRPRPRRASSTPRCGPA